MNEKLKNKKVNNFMVYSNLCIFLLFAIFEFGYCNFKTIVSDGRYNFSLCRIAVYLIAIILLIKYKSKFDEKAVQNFETKKMIIFYLLLFSFVMDSFQIKLICSDSSDFFNDFYVLILLVLAEINGILFVMYLNKNYINNIIITILTFGIFFTYSMPFSHQIDEKDHFLTCLNYSVGNFKLDKGYAVTDDVFEQLKINTSSSSFAISYFEKKCNFDITLVSFESAQNIPAKYRTPIAYIPGTIGILFARIFAGSAADVFLCGRLMNLLTFGALLVIVFKVLPYKKKLFYFIFLLPIALAIAATYTTDGVTIGFLGIFVAYVLKLYEENKERISVKDFFMLVLSYALVLTCKDSSYMGIGLLIFILPIKKYFKNNKKMLIVTICLVMLALSIGIYELQMKTSSDQGDTRTPNSNSVLQYEYIKESPSNLLKVYINYIRASFFKLNWYNNLNPKYFFGNECTIVNFGLFILGLYVSYIDTSKTFDDKTRVIMFVTFFVTFLVTSFALYLLYTPVGEDTIIGYQARYLIPFLPLLLMSFSSRKKIGKNVDDVQCYDKTAFVLGILTFIDIISQIVM